MKAADEILFPTDPQLEKLMDSLDDDEVHDDDNSDIETDFNDGESAIGHEDVEEPEKLDETFNEKAETKLSENKEAENGLPANGVKDTTSKRENVDQHKDYDDTDKEIENVLVDEPDATFISESPGKSVL